MAGVSGGEFIIQPLSAQISHNTQWFGKMDPYLEFEFEGQIKKSEICHKGGTTPKWSDTIIFQRHRDCLLNIKLWDFERFKSHDLIASKEINISDVIANGTKDTEVELEYDGNVGARVRVKFEFKPQQQPEKVGLTSMMMSSKKNGPAPPQPYMQFKSPTFGANRAYNEPPPMLSFPVPQPVLPSLPVGNVKSQGPNMVSANPYQQPNNRSAEFLPSSGSIPSSNSSIPVSNASTKDFGKKFTAEEMDAMLD